MTARATMRDRQRGAVLPLATLLLVALLAVTALVTDLGMQRTLRRSNQSLVDLAALAAGPSLANPARPDGRAGCADAVRYLRSNEAKLAGLTMDCAGLPASCHSTLGGSTVSQTVDNFRVSVTYPVPNSMIVDPVTASGRRAYDGDPCERLHVSVERTEPAILGGLLGRPQVRSQASAVVRQVAASNRWMPSLWLLDPTGCRVLTVDGGAQVTIGSDTVPGLISIDSDGSTCPSGYTVDVGGAPSRLTAVPTTTNPPGTIQLFAMAPGQTGCGSGNLRACDPADVAEGRLSPQPVRALERVTRAPVDHVYNCRSSYPSYAGVPQRPCDTSTRGAFIDQLQAAVGTSGVPLGFQQWSTAYSCSPTAGTYVAAGNWVVDCPNLKIVNNVHIRFTGGNVIFDGSITMDGGSMTLNAANPSPALPSGCTAVVTGCLAQSSAAASWAYQRSGHIALSGGALVANRATIYQHAGYVAMSGGSPPRWLAPTEGPFNGLALWSELASPYYRITGGSSLELEGVFFVPHANPLFLSGGSPVLSQPSQFIAYRAAFAGGAVLRLVPNWNHVSFPAPAVALIR